MVDKRKNKDSEQMSAAVVTLFKNDKNQEAKEYVFGEGKNYVIPEYQRAYSWNEKNIEDFMKSIERAVSDEKEKVFMGTLQFNREDKGNNRLDIIDGQQRLTTFLLLFRVLELLGKEKILQNNNANLKIRNFKGNDEALRNALNKEMNTIDEVQDGNLYENNLKLLKDSVAELIDVKKIPADEILRKIKKNMCFVELTTEGFSLPEVVNIFNTINTTGMDLNAPDIFKLQFYEYLKGSEENIPKKYIQNESENADNWMYAINKLYDELNTAGNNSHNSKHYNMENVLSIYKYCIGAACGFKFEILQKSNGVFFESLFNLFAGKKTEIDTRRKTEIKELLTFDEFEKIVKLYIKFGEWFGNSENWEAEADLKNISIFAPRLIWDTRYGRYWTLPFVSAYFKQKTKGKLKDDDYKDALEQAMHVANYLSVNSVNYDRYIYPVHRFICDTILPKFNDGGSIKEIIEVEINKSPYNRKDDKEDLWSSDEFRRRIKENLAANGKRRYIVCRLAALLEEVKENDGVTLADIKDKLFNWEDKSKAYDIEHIYSYELFKNRNEATRAKFNGIGNLVVLESTINRSLGSSKILKPKNKIKKNNVKDHKTYKDSVLAAVKYVAAQIEAIEKSKESWDIEEVRKRAAEQEKLLCKFLGLKDVENTSD